MTNNVLMDMLNTASLDDAKKGKIVYLNLDDLIPNPLNHASMSEIDALAENIAEGGLLQPLLVIKGSNGIRIHSGHRRYQALLKLRDAGKPFDYMGKQFTDEVPCIYVDGHWKTQVDEEISLMRSNSYRHYDPNERKQVVLRAHELFQMLPVEQQPKGREREWITALTGISDGTVKKILAELNKTDLPEMNDQEVGIELAEEKNDINKEARKIVKAMIKVVDLYGAKSFSNKDLDPKVKESLTKATSDLMDVLMRGSY